MTRSYVADLRALRMHFVGARRDRVTGSLRFDCPAGSEKRLLDIQAAIAAIDAAILDEEELAAAHDLARPAGANPGGERRQVSLLVGNGPNDDSVTDEEAEPPEPLWTYSAWQNGQRLRRIGFGRRD